MEQITFTDCEYSNRRRQTKRDKFLEMMDNIIPWSDWIDIIAPFYPDGKRGRNPIGIETMLRMFFLQIWFHLSDEGTEDAIYDSYAMKRFLHLDFSNDSVPDATTLLKFRHLLENNHIQEKLFKDVNARLERAGLIMHGGSIVDATIIEAPNSTKNIDKKRDPEMHSTKKANQWRFGMKIHAGVDAGSGYVHSITATSANVHDINEAHKLIREDDEVVYGDSGYLGLEKRDEIKNDDHLSKVECKINRRPSQNKISKSYKGKNWDKYVEQRKSSVRCKVEHPFLIVKKLFGYGKVVYRGIAKNLARFFALFASANIVMCYRAGREKEFCAA